MGATGCDNVPVLLCLYVGWMQFTPGSRVVIAGAEVQTDVPVEPHE